MKSKLLINPDISKRDLTVSFQKTLEGTDVFFSFVWNKKRPIALVQLISTLGDNTEETDHLNNPIKDTDGELSVRLGTFNKDDVLTIQFGVLAFAKIDESAVFMNQSNPAASKKVLPSQKNKYKSIEAGKLWNSKFKYKVIGNEIA